MTDETGPSALTPAGDRPAARRTLSVVIRVGALMLSSGATTDEVELAMGRIAAASGLENVTAIVQFGTISVAYDPGPDAEPITLLRVARRTSADYGRLAGSAELARRLYESRMSVDDALDEVERLEMAAPPYPGWVTWLAAGVAAGGTTVLFGGGPAEVAVAALATVAARPALAWLTSVGLPTFFRNVIGPAIAVVIVMGLFALGLPYSAPIAVTGAIMIFLPGGALAAGMRDLIDGSIVSGTARLSEAILLGAAVGIGISVGLAIAALWGPTIEFELPSFEPFTIATQAAAAAVACAALALHNGVPTRFVLSIALVGAGGLVIDRVARASGVDPILATGMAAAFIGGAGRWLASRNRASASIWIAAAALPILPGRLLVEGLLEAPAGGGSVELLTALLVGFAIGIGAALGDVVVATVRRFNRTVVQPVVIAPAIGLVEGGLTWVAQGGHPTRRRAASPGDGADDAAG
jgi:uncharacterized membrane protein YjjP (DUF1212 family)